MINLYIIVNNKKIPLLKAKNFKQKLLGLMFKKKINYCLMFKCNGIHTFFMRSKIDVILTDENNNVLKVYQNLKINKIILPKRKVKFTYELPPNTIQNINIKKIKIVD